jgi:glutathione synthase/RimK-type ligase-like ATP-grasp enzyme
VRGRARVALVTARQRPEVDIDVDMPLLAAALADVADVSVVAWDDPQVSWASFDLAVIRSTWDYAWRAREFLAWAGRCAAVTRLANPAPLIRWNADKGYLRGLRGSGLAVVPTTYLPAGGRDQVDLPADHEYVVKPVVGAGARYAARYRPGERDRAQAHVRRLHAEGLGVMVQPYLDTVDVAGERALVFVGGEYLHAVRKGPVLAHGARYDEPRPAHPGLRPWSATSTEVALARRALAAIPVPTEPLYARVDLVDGGGGEPMIMELELIEPNLFLVAHRDSIAQVARAIVRAAVAPDASRTQVPGSPVRHL